MTVLLSTLNSKYIHTNLAIRYLKAFVRDIEEVNIKEFTINQNIDHIMAEVYKNKPNLVGFSTYIWNIDETLQICEGLKMVSPQTKILLGGPEVSYDPVEIMEEHPYIDYIIYGEGEETFRELLLEKPIENINGLVYRGHDKIVKNPERKLIGDLSTIPFPYEDEQEDFKNKIIYYESSRGCPFNCEFCLSSTIKGLRYLPIDRVKRELDTLIGMGVKQVKFVDRTFNAKKDYSMEIMKHILVKNPKDINFHFEVTAHLIDEHQLDFFKGVREGLFQFEIGVQSTNPNTIEAIGRTTDFEKLKEVSMKIKSFNNIHQHLDLIVGLPYEDYKSFEESFNDIYSIGPEKIQLGFLKLLKGSGLRTLREKYGFKFLNKAPYEILENKYITYDEIIRLKGIEEMVERYYNEEFFKNTLNYVIGKYFISPFKFYEELSQYFVERGLFEISHSRAKLYGILYGFLEDRLSSDLTLIKELLRFDYILNNTDRRIPREINNGITIDASKIHQLLKDEYCLSLLPENLRLIPTKQLLKKTTIALFNINILDFVESGYNKDAEAIESIMLFYHSEGTIIRSMVYDITSQYKEMIN